jgi:MFS family permease
LPEGVKARRRSRVPLFAPLRHRAFRLLFAGQVVSDLGDWLDLLALLALLAFQWRLGAPALAALTMAMLLPSALVAPFAGVLADRWPRRGVMIACDLSRAALALGLVWAPSLAVVLALVLAKGTLGTLFGAARQATIRQTVPEDDLLSTNALSRLSGNVTKVAGPALGGLLVASVGPRAAFVADALTFLISASLLAGLRLSASPRPAESEAGSDAESDQARADHARSRGRFWRELRAGITYIWSVPVLAAAVGAAMAEMLIVESNDSLTVLALKGLGMGEALVGIAIGCSGLGNVFGALPIGQWGQRVRPLRLMGLGCALVGGLEAVLGAALLLGVSQSPHTWLPLLALAGAGFAMIWIPLGAILQRETPHELLGRVSATAGALYTAVGLAGPPLGAYLAQRIGVGAVFAVTGGALLLLGVGIVALGGSSRGSVTRARRRRGQC